MRGLPVEGRFHAHENLAGEFAAPDGVKARVAPVAARASSDRQ